MIDIVERDLAAYLRQEHLLERREEALQARRDAGLSEDFCSDCPHEYTKLCTARACGNYSWRK